MITGILAGIAGKLAGLGVAAKAGIGLGIATVATAGVATVLPVVVPDTSGGTTAAVQVQLPSVPTANADPGLGVAADATRGQVGADAQTGLDIAAQAAASVPPVTPPLNGAGAAGIDRARQTPAADHLPAFVPGPPASVPPVTPPVSLPPAAAAGATGIDAATETPGSQFIPPFVKGMFGRS